MKLKKKNQEMLRKNAWRVKSEREREVYDGHWWLMTIEYSIRNRT